MNRREFLKGVAAAAALMCCPVVGGKLPGGTWIPVDRWLKPMHLIVTWRAGGLSHVAGRDVMVAGLEHLRAIEDLLKDGHRRGYYEAYSMLEFHHD